MIKHLPDISLKISRLNGNEINFLPEFADQ